MEIMKRMLKAFVGGMMLLLVALITTMFANIIAEISPTLLIVVCIVMLLKSGYDITKD